MGRDEIHPEFSLDDFSLFTFTHLNPDRHQHMIFILSHHFQSRDSHIKGDTENRYFFPLRSAMQNEDILASSS